jgi:hypothetical protein
MHGVRMALSLRPLSKSDALIGEINESGSKGPMCPLARLVLSLAIRGGWVIIICWLILASLARSSNTAAHFLLPCKDDFLFQFLDDGFHDTTLDESQIKKKLRWFSLPVDAAEIGVYHHIFCEIIKNPRSC